MKKNNNKENTEFTVDDEGSDELENSLSSWHFDLGPLGEASEQKVTPKEKTTERSSEDQPQVIERRRFTVGVDLSTEWGTDDLSILSDEMEEASEAMRSITSRVIKQTIQSRRASMNSSEHTCSDMSTSCISDDGETITLSGDFEEGGKGGKVTQRRDDQDSLLEQRRAAREARMKKVRERIARERQKKEEEARQKKLESYNSEEARRQRVFDWYCRWGRITRREMKRKLKAIKKTSEIDIDESDIDLLPWNFNGTLIDATKLNKQDCSRRGRRGLD